MCSHSISTHLFTLLTHLHRSSYHFNFPLDDTSVTSSESASVVSEASEQESIDDQTSAKLTLGGTDSLFVTAYWQFYRDSRVMFVPITLTVFIP